MRIEWTEPPHLGQVGLRAVPEEYDAIRFPEALLLDRGPRLRSAERLAVAGTLLFGGRSEGRIILPGAISPLAAREIERYLAPSWVRVGAIDLVARRLPPGNNSLLVLWEGQPVPARSAGVHERRRMALRLARSDMMSGSSVGVGEMVVSSNAWLFTGPNDGVEGFGPLLALGLLFAEDLEAESIAVSVEGSGVEPDELHPEYGGLLAAAGLKLEVVS